MFSCTLSIHHILLSGPAEALFKPEFFLSMKNALGPNGLICTQGECMWLHLDLIAGVFQQCKEIFPSVKYAYTTIPTYPSGQRGFIIASNDDVIVLLGSFFTQVPGSIIVKKGQSGIVK